LNGKFNLPASKSISNRLLIIKVLAQSEFRISNLSDSDDTRLLQKALSFKSNVIKVGNAGTAFRFLTALLSMRPGEWILTGSKRMKSRPVGILVDALRTLGADISYLENEGFPPLKIIGSSLHGGSLVLDGSVSSQYTSALLMLAPVLPGGLLIKLKGKITSKPFIRLTLELMSRFGIEYSWTANSIRVRQQEYKSRDFAVEADWTAASYWYEIAALSEQSDLFLKGLTNSGLQGDAIIAEIFKSLGVKTRYLPGGVQLTKESYRKIKFNFDFTGNPDLAQTLTVTLTQLNIPFRLTGLKNLRVKEADRIQALMNELGKTGIILEEPAEGVLEWNGSRRNAKQNKISVKTYKDHRMAMSFAPVCLKSESIIVKKPDVVSKSYPGFWDELNKAGFFIDFFSKKISLRSRNQKNILTIKSV
jgi:3-phosphoshikimate 1-carboxyvinyltransferase